MTGRRRNDERSATAVPSVMGSEAPSGRVSKPAASEAGAYSSGLVNRSETIGVSAAAVDRLLVAICELPVAEGERAVAEAMLDALADVFPGAAVGLCVASECDGQWVIKREPTGREQTAASPDPTRIFPGYQEERIVSLDPVDGSTMHVAFDVASAPTFAEAQLGFLMERAALGLRRGLSFARAHSKANNMASSLQEMTEHMVQAEKLASLGQIAAGVVHELNNPLTTIVAYTDYLRKKAKASDSDADAADLQRLERISESANRILRFARDLVAYARPAAEDASPVQVHAVIEQALAFCEHVLSEHHVTVHRKFAKERLVALGMNQQLVQVFVNLVTNACHAMPAEGAELCVSTERSENGGVRIRVSDNGHGIPREHAADVFQPFFTTKVDGKGSGLGLSIVKNIIDRHDGRVVVEPQTTGVTFVLELPRGD